MPLIHPPEESRDQRTLIRRGLFLIVTSALSVPAAYLLIPLTLSLIPTEDPVPEGLILVGGILLVVSLVLATIVFVVGLTLTLIGMIGLIQKPGEV